MTLLRWSGASHLSWFSKFGIEHRHCVSGKTHLKYVVFLMLQDSIAFCPILFPIYNYSTFCCLRNHPKWGLVTRDALANKLPRPELQFHNTYSFVFFTWEVEWQRIMPKRMNWIIIGLIVKLRDRSKTGSRHGSDITFYDISHCSVTSRTSGIMCAMNDWLFMSLDSSQKPSCLLVMASIKEEF